VTLETALTISSLRAVDLWKLCHQEAATGTPGYHATPDSLRETALDILTTEVERLRAELAAARLLATTKFDLDRALAAWQARQKGTPT